MAATKYCIRIRPYDVKKKAITRRYTIRGVRFDHKDPWRITGDRELAKELSQVKDRNGNPIFEVKSLSAAQADRRRNENDPTMGDELSAEAFRKAKTSQLGITESMHPAAKAFEGGDAFEEEDFKAPDPYAGMDDVDFEAEDKEDIFAEPKEEKLEMSKPAAKKTSRKKSTRKATPRKRRSESV